jgi:hypothetical protein
MARFFTDQELCDFVSRIPVAPDVDPDTPEFHALERERRAIERRHIESQDFGARTIPNAWIDLATPADRTEDYDS